MNTSIKTRSLTALCAFSAVLMLSSCGKKADDTATAPSPASPSIAASSTTASPSPTASMSPGTMSPGNSMSAAKMSPAAVGSVPAIAARLGVKPTDTTTCPASAPVKGKVTKKRGNIYHVAKGPDYARVKPEICFKDTATAEKAGFRAPK